jgi:hypothetical protein
VGLWLILPFLPITIIDQTEKRVNAGRRPELPAAADLRDPAGSPFEKWDLKRSNNQLIDMINYLSLKDRSDHSATGMRPKPTRPETLISSKGFIQEITGNKLTKVQGTWRRAQGIKDLTD